MDSWDSWYSAQGFRTKTDYGYHEGEDFNLLSGGNSDLGQPLYAIADGTITSVELLTKVPSFGKHIHLKIETPQGTRWAHYCHCDQVFVQSGQTVKQGDRIATVGRTGTTLAHLHFAIKNAPTGINGIAKTQEDLKKWDSPLEFLGRGMASLVITDQTRIPQIGNKEVQAIGSEMRDKDKTINDLKTQMQPLKDKIASDEGKFNEIANIINR